MAPAVNPGRKITVAEAARIANKGTIKQRIAAARKRLRAKYPKLKVKP